MEDFYISGAEAPIDDIGTYLSFRDMLAYLLFRPGSKSEEFLRETEPKLLSSPS